MEPFKCNYVLQAHPASTERQPGPYGYCHSVISHHRWIKHVSNADPERMYLPASTNYFLPPILAFIHYRHSSQNSKPPKGKQRANRGCSPRPEAYCRSCTANSGAVGPKNPCAKKFSVLDSYFCTAKCPVSCFVPVPQNEMLLSPGL